MGISHGDRGADIPQYPYERRQRFGQSNASNALTNEKAYYSSNGKFEDLTGGSGAGSEADGPGRGLVLERYGGGSRRPGNGDGRVRRPGQGRSSRYPRPAARGRALLIEAASQEQRPTAFISRTTRTARPARPFRSSLMRVPTTRPDAPVPTWRSRPRRRWRRPVRRRST